MWPATLSSPALRADVLITVLGAVGAFAYLLHLDARPHRSLIESRTRLLVGTMAVLCAVRAIGWIHPQDLGLQIIAFTPATLLPVAMTLFVEGLLRRHVPLGVKLFGVGIGGAAFLVNALRAVIGPTITSRALGATFAAGLLLHMALLGLVLLRRDRRSLSRAENGLVDVVLWATLLGLPLAATDFRPALGWPPNRMGAIAVLLFLYTVLRPARARAPRRRWAYDVARLAAVAVLAASAFTFLVGRPSNVVLVHLVSAAVAVVLLAAVLQRMRELRLGERNRQIMGWMAEPVPETLEQFARALRRLPLTADAVLIREEDLRGYDVPQLVAELRAGPLAHAHGTLASSHVPPRGREELLDLLERHGMTHVAMVREHPLLLLLVASPELPGAGSAEEEIALVVRRAQHVLTLEAGPRYHVPTERAHVH